MSTKTDVDFRISMLAPSRAGKTTLLASIYNVLRERTTESGYQVGFDKANQMLLNILKNEYEAIFATAQKKFEETGERIFSPSMGIKPSVEQTSYKIFIHTPEQQDFYDKRKSIPEMLAGILFRDYPGGLLDNPEEFPEDLIDHITLSRVMLVPIPADILEEYSKNTENAHVYKHAKTYLNVESICEQLQKWIKQHVEREEECYLCFVPVKCEHFFNDNGGKADRSEELFELVENNFISKIKLSDNAKKMVQIDIRPVDTYGISEYSHAEITEDSWMSFFKIRETFQKFETPKARTKGVFELFVSILNFILSSSARSAGVKKDELISRVKNRSVFDHIKVALGKLLGQKDDVAVQAQILTSKETAFILMADGIAAMANDDLSRVKKINSID